MRTKKEYVRVALEKEVHKRLVEDRDHFQETIGGGKWSLSDTLEEYFKVMPKRK